MQSKLKRGVDKPNLPKRGSGLSVVIPASELGTECWSVMRFRDCVGCDRYHRCTYSVRKWDPEYDRLEAVRKQKYAELMEAQHAASDYWMGLTPKT